MGYNDNDAVVLKDFSFHYSAGHGDNTKEHHITGLRKVNLRIQRGESVALVGASGCGKSSILRAINGLIPHFHSGKLSGTVCVCGIDVAHEELWKTGRVVSTVFQNPRTQFFTTDTTAELAFALENQSVEPAIIRARINENTRRIGTHHLLDRNIFTLSGGEKQLIACTASMVENPQVYLFDEPTSNLSAHAIDDFRHVLAELRQRHATMVIAEHRLHFLRGLIDRVCIVDQGRIVEEMSVVQFFAMTDKQAHQRGLRTLVSPKMRRVDCHLQPPPRGTIHSRLALSARNQGDVRCDIDPSSGAPGLRLTNVQFSYEDHNVLHIDRAFFPSGKVCVLVGENGAGKSTLAAAICGLNNAKGHFVFTDTYEHRLRRRERRRLCYYVMQDVHRQLFGASTQEELLIGIHSAQRKDVQICQVLDDYGLLHEKDRHPMALSGGQKQRLVIASAHIARKKIYIFDEPSSGLDYRHLRTITQMLQRIAQKGNVVIVITHDIELMNSCADLIYCLHKQDTSASTH
ncbi:MAG: ABC transporter ATP-binding protein [Actinomycetaceae bacterium]|nr:ABC transporter ATP-binding protein [Actinomycetaceae bacterium]